ncbi:Mobile element protein [uncultured Gammaproteobacteria bacterium]|nr:Mobile element protein [uncultured Gammaproteobacteria bacterium]
MLKSVPKPRKLYTPENYCQQTHQRIATQTFPHIACLKLIKRFLFYQQVLAQQPKDKNKIYSLHEPDVYVIAKGKGKGKSKGKDHKQYEYGNKVSIVSTKDNNIIVGVVSHDKTSTILKP